MANALNSNDDALAAEDQSGGACIAGGPLKVNKIGEVQPGKGSRGYVEARQTLSRPAAGSSSPAAAQEPRDGTLIYGRVDDTIVGEAPVRNGAAVLTIPGPAALAPTLRPHTKTEDRSAFQTGREDVETAVRIEIYNMLGDGSKRWSMGLSNPARTRQR